jgi:dTDP-4-amino-4,6-dideoxygalactose transaminase
MRQARGRIAGWYCERFSREPFAAELDLPTEARPDEVHAWHLYPVRLRRGGAERRARVIAALKVAGIGSSVHFIPLHLHPHYRRTYGYRPDDLPIATREYEREISLPIYPDLTESEVDRIAEALGRALAER